MDITIQDGIKTANKVIVDLFGNKEGLFKDLRLNNLK
jgi:hypothetical protein